MKSFLNKFFIGIFINLMIPSFVFANDNNNNLNDALKHSSYEPNFFSIVLSLIFVIALIYVTGIVYTKLNKLSVHTVKKELREDSDIKPVIISTTPVGHEKNLHVIEIAGQRLLIGVAGNSINLIKDLGRISYKQNVSSEDKTEESEHIEIKQNIEENNTVENEVHSVDPEDFGLYKKYLR